MTTRPPRTAPSLMVRGGAGVQILQEVPEVADEKDLVARPWSEPMVWTDGAEPTPLSKYDGDLVDKATVGVHDEPAGEVAMRLNAEGAKQAADAATADAAAEKPASAKAKK